MPESVSEFTSSAECSGSGHTQMRLTFSNEHLGLGPPERNVCFHPSIDPCIYI